MQQSVTFGRGHRRKIKEEARGKRQEGMNHKDTKAQRKKEEGGPKKGHFSFSPLQRT